MEKEAKDEGRGIVRFFGADLDGKKSVRNALLRVKGLSFVTARAMAKTAGIDLNAVIGELSEDGIERLRKAVESPKIPRYLLNRRNDPVTGKDSHLVSADLDIHLRQDLESMKKLRMWKGMRHIRGQPVRGQRTRSSFRTSKGTLGVIKAKAMRSAAAAPKEAPKKEEKKK